MDSECENMPTTYIVCSPQYAGVAAATTIANHPTVYIVDFNGEPLSSVPNLTAHNVRVVENVQGAVGSDELAGVPHLAVLTGHSITSIGPGALASLDGRWLGVLSAPWGQGATRIEIYESSIAEVPDFQGVGMVSKILITDSALSTIRPHAFDGIRSLWPYLSMIDLQYNQITLIEAYAFANPNISNLAILRLDDNLITLVEPHGFSGLTNLMNLGITNNVLRAVPSFVGANFTKDHSDVYGCGVRGSYPIDYSGGPQNLPQDSDANVLDWAESVLLLTNNSITSAVAADFSPQFGRGLCQLYLDENVITALDVGQFQNLQSLYLAHNRITRITNYSIPPSIFILSGLSENNITAIEARGLYHLYGLNALILPSTGLRSIAPGALSDLISIPAPSMLSDYAQSEANFASETNFLWLSPNPLSCTGGLDPSATHSIEPYMRLLNTSSNCLLSYNGSCIEIPQNDVGGFCSVEVLRDFTAMYQGGSNYLQATFDVIWCTLDDTWVSPLCENSITIDGVTTGTQFRLPNEKVLAGSIIEVKLNTFFGMCAAEASPMNLSDISCQSCVLGYAFNASTGFCDFPPFGTSANWDPSTRKGDLPAVLYVNQTYTVAAPDLTPLNTAFVGYSDSDFTAIRYALSLEAHDEYHVGCGSVRLGSTVGRANNYSYKNPDWNATYPPPRTYGEPICQVSRRGPGFCAYELNGDMEDSRRIPLCNDSCTWSNCTANRPSSDNPNDFTCPYFNDAPDVAYHLEVLTPGNITFDTCLTSFSNSIAIFNANGDIIYPSTETMLMLYSWPSKVPYYVRAQVPAQGGCQYSVATNVTVPFETPGNYTVVLDSANMWMSINRFEGTGNYAFSVLCTDGATTTTVRNGPGGMSVDPDTGELVITPQFPGSYHVNLTAVDGSGAVATIQQWNITVKDRGIFEPVNTTETNRTWYSPTVPSILPINATSRFLTPLSAAHNVTSVLDSTFQNFLPPVHFQLTTSGGDVPDLGDFLIDTTTGYLEVSPTRPLNTNLTLTATDSTGKSCVVTRFHVQTQLRDTANCKNGPSGRCCTHGGRPVDPVEFDHAFTCDCSGTLFTGPLCETPKDVTLIASVTTSVTVAAAMAVALIWWRARRRGKWQPTDFAALQRELLEELGVSHLKDIKENEIGFALTLDGLEVTESGVPILAIETARGISRAVQRVLGGSIVLDQERLPTMNNGSHNEATIVLARSPGQKQDGAIDTVLLQRLRQAIDQRGIRSGSVGVTAFSLLTPRRIPRSIDRSTVHRIEQVGSGASSLVFKAQVVPKRGENPFLVACKEPLPSSISDVERESALMAMLDRHPNIVRLVGVVQTTPKWPMQLLLLEYCEHGTLEGHIRRLETSELSTMMQLSFCADIASGMDFLSSRRVVHRDLAARNVLIDSLFTCKVSPIILYYCPSQSLVSRLVD